MKVVIFSVSIKEGKNSNTKAWCEALDCAFKENNYKSEIITLRDYDHEASNGKDLLHEQMAKLYDADLIFFASPLNFSNYTFYLHNLLDRFVYAHKKSLDKGLNIFANKRIELCPLGGCTTDQSAPKNADWEEYEKKFYKDGELVSTENYNMRHHKRLYKKLHFIKPLGVHRLHINSWNPQEPIGPDRRNMRHHPQTVAGIKKILDKIKSIGLDKQETRPAHTIDEFIECFESNDSDAFGRGLTVAAEDITYESAKRNLTYIHTTEHIPNYVRYQAIVAMKDRSVRAGVYDAAELYYNEQIRYDRDWYEGRSTYDLNKNGNMRPNNY